MKFWENFNSKLFRKVFTVITIIILVCSLSISVAIYYRFDATMSAQNINFITDKSYKIKSDIISLTRKCEWIAGSIYSDSGIGTLLQENYYSGMDAGLFETVNKISSTLQGIEDNNREISSITIYKRDPKLVTNGNEIRDMEEFSQQELLNRALEAKGNNIWATYRDESGKIIFCLLKFLNINNPGGILVIELQEAAFLELYTKGLGTENNLFIIDESQNVISSNIREGLGKTVNAFLKGYSPENATARKITFNKTPYFFNTDRVNTEWRLVMIYDAYEVEREKRYMQYYVLVLTGVFIFIGMLFSLFLASGFTSQVDKLMGKIKEIEKGNLKIKPDIEKLNEFHQLDKTLCSMAQSIEKLNEDVVKAVKQKEESDIKYLQMQMKPHFLYNMLSVVRWIAYNNHQKQILQIIDNLSNFYKITLSKGNEIIDIESEVKLVKSFVELQNLCSEQNIHLNIFIDEKLSGLKIGKMTLQPFVENSVIHGRIASRELNIDIRAVKETDNTVKITIEDDGAGITGEVVNYIESLNEKALAIEGKHYGITNTITRLRLLYGAGVSIHAMRKEQGTRIEIIIE